MHELLVLNLSDGVQVRTLKNLKLNNLQQLRYAHSTGSILGGGTYKKKTKQKCK